MALPNVFDGQVTARLIERLHKISPETRPVLYFFNAGCKGSPKLKSSVLSMGHGLMESCSRNIGHPFYFREHI